MAKLKREGYWQDEGEDLVEPQGDEPLSDTYEASIRGVIQFGPQAGRRLAKVFAEVAVFSVLGFFESSVLQCEKVHQNDTLFSYLQ